MSIEETPFDYLTYHSLLILYESTKDKEGFATIVHDEIKKSLMRRIRDNTFKGIAVYCPLELSVAEEN